MKKVKTQSQSINLLDDANDQQEVKPKRKYTKKTIPVEENNKPKRKYTKRVKKEAKKESEENVQNNIIEQEISEERQNIITSPLRYKSNWEPREKIQLREANKYLGTTYEDWDILSEHPNLTKDEKFIEKYYEFLNWYIIGTKQNYSKTFFNKYKRRLYWVNLI